MIKTILATVALLFTLSALGGQPLDNPLLDYLNDADVSYIAVVDQGELVVHIISGQFDQVKVADLANSVDFKVKLVEYEHKLVDQ
jgi:hypothetical protein